MRVPEKDVIFIAVDAEADETTGRIWQLGLSFLDTRNIIDVTAGPGAQDWMPHVRTIHYLVAKEDNRLREFTNINTRYSGGDPASFSLGQTRHVTLSQMKVEIRKLFEEPFDAMAKPAQRTRRNLVFVAQGIRNEYKFLAQLNFDPRQQ